MNEAEWQTRRMRIDTKLRARAPASSMVPWRNDLDVRSLDCHAVTEFGMAYGKDTNRLSRRTDTGKTGHFRKFPLNEIKERGYQLDITWLKDESLEDSDELPEPQDLAGEAITELEAVVDDLREIVALIEKQEGVEK